MDLRQRLGAILHALDITEIQYALTRVVAERHVQEVLGRVPPATEFLRRIRGERWMLQATSPRRLGLDTPTFAARKEAADVLA